MAKLLKKDEDKYKDKKETGKEEKGKEEKGKKGKEEKGKEEKGKDEKAKKSPEEIMKLPKYKLLTKLDKKEKLTDAHLESRDQGQYISEGELEDYFVEQLTQKMQLTKKGFKDIEGLQKAIQQCLNELYKDKRYNIKLNSEKSRGIAEIVVWDHVAMQFKMPCYLEYIGVTKAF